MKRHTKIYLDFFGFTIADFIPCEIHYALGDEIRANDIHHIDARGMGGSKQKDNIENLMALCRKCHDDYGDIKQFKPYLIKIHNQYTKRYEKKQI